VTIKIDDVHKEFNGMPVLRGVKLFVPKGCLYGLIGPGASGKSVLLKMVAGLVRPERGHVLVEDRDIHAMSELELAQFRLKYGMLFQNNALFDYMTVGDNIAFPMRRMTRMSEAEIQAVAKFVRETIVNGRILEDLLIPDDKLNRKKD